MDADPCRKEKEELEAALRELRRANVAALEYAGADAPALPDVSGGRPQQYAALLANAFNQDGKAREVFLEKLMAWADCQRLHAEGR